MKTEITYANFNASKPEPKGPLPPGHFVIEAEGYPYLSVRGQRRRGPWKGYHRGFVSPIPVANAAIMRYTGEVDEAGKRQMSPLGIFRAHPKMGRGKYPGSVLRYIRAKKGVGRPVCQAA